MINPLLVATDGYLPGPTTLSIATNGYLGAGAVAVEYRGGGQRGGAWDLDRFEMDLQERRILEEDEELLEIIIMALTSGVLD